jgi:alcohol dehydrogenase
MTFGTLRLPSRIHFGYGVRARIPELLGEHGRRVLALVDPALAASPLVREILSAVRASGAALDVVTEIEPELPVASLQALGAGARTFGPDAFLAIGGGSTIDAAKVVALLATADGPLDRFYGENAVGVPVLPLVAVPTTSGTGSEVTPVAVVSDPERELKVGISSPRLIPVAAVVDPELTLAAPPSVTAFAGIDALVHAVESFTARPIDPDPAVPLPVFTGRNAFTDVVALDAAELLGRWLPVAVAEPGHREAREQLALGSLLAGMSFGPTGTHLSHALQYPIGGLTHTPHGLGTGLLLPYVVEAIAADPETAGRIARIGRALGGGPVEGDAARGAIEAIVRLNAAIGIPRSLADIGIDRDALPRIAELGMRSARLVAISPVDATPELLLRVLERAHAGLLSDALPT